MATLERQEDADMRQFGEEIQRASDALREVETYGASMCEDIKRLRSRVNELQWIEQDYARPRARVRSRAGATMIMDTGWYHEIRRQVIMQCRNALSDMIGQSFPIGTDPLQEAEKRLSLLAVDEEAELGSPDDGSKTYRSISRFELPRADAFQIGMEFDENREAASAITRLTVDTGDHVTTYMPVTVDQKDPIVRDPIVNVDTDGIPPYFDGES